MKNEIARGNRMINKTILLIVVIMISLNASDLGSIQKQVNQLEINNKIILKENNELKQKIQLLENNYKTEIDNLKENYKNQKGIYENIIKTNQDTHSNVMNYILIVLGIFGALLGYFSITWIEKQVDSKIDSKANDKINELKEIIENTSKIEIAINNKIAEYDSILLEYKDKLKELKDSPTESFTTEQSQELKMLVDSISKKTFKSDEDWFYIGLEYQKEKKYPEALKNYEKALEINPKNIYALNSSGYIHAKENRPEKALELFEKSRDINPQNYQTLDSLAVVYVSMKKFNKAIESYKSAIKLKEDYLSAYTNLFEAYLLSNQNIEKEIEEQYLKHCNNDLSSLAKYDMINILYKIKQKETQDNELEQWKEKYKNISLNWEFYDMISWANEESNESVKTQLNQAINTFKEQIN